MSIKSFFKKAAGPALVAAGLACTGTGLYEVVDHGFVKSGLDDAAYTVEKDINAGKTTFNTAEIKAIDDAYRNSRDYSTGIFLSFAGLGVAASGIRRWKKTLGQ